MSAGPVLPVPELVDVVPAAEADRILVETRAELAALEADLAAARSAADAAERRVIEERADPALLGRATEELQRFFEQRRSSLDTEVDAMLASARLQATIRNPAPLEAPAPGEPMVVEAVAVDPPAIERPAIFPELVVEPEPEAVALLSEPPTAAAPVVEAEPVGLRLGSIPAVALLQVVGLLVVLVVLLVFVS